LSDGAGDGEPSRGAVFLVAPGGWRRKVGTIEPLLAIDL